MVTIFSSCASNKKVTFKKDCDKGEALACFELGRLESKEKSLFAKIYFEKACRMGHERSCDYHLTSFLKENKIQDSADYYERECKSSNTYSCTVLGRIYFNLGYIKKGLDVYKKSCSNSGPSACAFLSLEHYKKNENIEELRYIEKACQLGLSGKDKTPMYCVLSGNSFVRLKKINDAKKYYKLACLFKESDQKTLLYKMLGCSRAGLFHQYGNKKAGEDGKDDKEFKDMYDLGVGYLKSKCLSVRKKSSYKDCYDLAGLYSLQKKPGESLKYLELALKKGFRDWKHILVDHELNFMRSTLPFKKLVNRYYRLSKKKGL